MNKNYEVGFDCFLDTPQNAINAGYEPCYTSCVSWVSKNFTSKCIFLEVISNIKSIPETTIKNLYLNLFWIISLPLLVIFVMLGGNFILGGWLYYTYTPAKVKAINSSRNKHVDNE